MGWLDDIKRKRELKSVSTRKHLERVERLTEEAGNLITPILEEVNRDIFAGRAMLNKDDEGCSESEHRADLCTVWSIGWESEENPDENPIIRFWLHVEEDFSTYFEVDWENGETGVEEVELEESAVKEYIKKALEELI